MKNFVAIKKKKIGENRKHPKAVWVPLLSTPTESFRTLEGSTGNGNSVTVDELCVPGSNLQWTQGQRFSSSHFTLGSFYDTIY